jgi:deoxynucleoside triphosphate triphosphohydrolase SAMHD1
VCIFDPATSPSPNPRTYGHERQYDNRKAKAVEFMVVDALAAADPALGISKKVWDPAEFQLLDDGILDLVENFDFVRGMAHIEQDADAAIKAAQTILARLRRRDLYKYVNDALVPSEIVDSGLWRVPTAEDIVTSYSGTDHGVFLKAEDVIIQENRIDYSMQDRNPLERVHFYDVLESREKRKLKPADISSMVVASFEVGRVVLFCFVL